MLQKLICGRDLPSSASFKLFQSLVSGNLKAARARSTLALLTEKGETVEELAMLTRVLRLRGITVGPFEHPFLVDNCGTGGDGQGTFNISTTAAFVAAGAGAYVAKHGNRSVSSRSGSSDVLESLGVNLTASSSLMLRALREAHLGYFHAPLYQPALKTLHSVRRSLGIRTIFNLVGPLINPLRVKKQLIGVSRREHLLLIAKVLKRMHLAHGVVVHGDTGLDEVALTGRTEIYEVRSGELRHYVFDPQKTGLHRCRLSELHGGTATDNRKITIGILRGTIRGPKRDVVLLNAAFTLYAADRARSIAEGLGLARESIESGNALRSLELLKRISNGGDG